MKITAIRVKNFKRIKEVEIDPGERSLLVIGGKNRAGKSSVLDALTAAFGGKRQSPEQAVRRGAKKAEIVAELDGGKLIVERLFSKKGTHRLEVHGQNGAMKSPQKVLDQLVGQRFLDPLEFLRQDAKTQRATLLRCVDLGIDLNDLASKRVAAYERRRDLARDIKRLQAERETIGDFPEGDEVVDLSALTKVLNDAIDARYKLKETRDHLAFIDREEKETKRTIGEIKGQIESLQARLAEREAALTALRSECEKVATSLATLESGVPGTEDIEELRDQISIAESHNRAVAMRRAAKERAEQIDSHLAALTSEHDGYQKSIELIDHKRAEALENAEMPVAGLSVDDESLLYDGVPLSQASSAQQLEVSLAIAMALKPELRDVWVKDGSLLDDESMEIVRRLAEANGYRVWLERVGDSDDGCIVIEEGKVRDETTHP